MKKLLQLAFMLLAIVAFAACNGATTEQEADLEEDQDQVEQVEQMEPDMDHDEEEHHHDDAKDCGHMDKDEAEKEDAPEDQEADDLQ